MTHKHRFDLTEGSNALLHLLSNLSNVRVCYVTIVDS